MFSEPQQVKIHNWSYPNSASHLTETSALPTGLSVGQSQSVSNNLSAENPLSIQPTSKAAVTFNDDDIERLSDEEDPLSIVESQRDDVETSKADDEDIARIRGAIDRVNKLIEAFGSDGPEVARNLEIQETLQQLFPADVLSDWSWLPGHTTSYRESFHECLDNITAEIGYLEEGDVDRDLVGTKDDNGDDVAVDLSPTDNEHECFHRRHQDISVPQGEMSSFSARLFTIAQHQPPPINESEISQHIAKVQEEFHSIANLCSGGQAPPALKACTQRIYESVRFIVKQCGNDPDVIPVCQNASTLATTLRILTSVKISIGHEGGTGNTDAEDNDERILSVAEMLDESLFQVAHSVHVTQLRRNAAMTKRF